MFQVKTGYGDPNFWVEWVKYTIQSLSHSKCYACASGQPSAQVVPCPLGGTRDLLGMEHMIALYQEKTAWGNEACKSPSLFCPSLHSSDTRVPPMLSTAVGHHTVCLSPQGVNATRPLGKCVLCTETLYDGFEWNYLRLRIPRADWWYCRGKARWFTLPSKLEGT